MSSEHKISSSKLKHFVFMFFGALLFLPMIQQQFNLVKEKKLEGVDNYAALPAFAINPLLNGHFQKDFETSLDVNIGFRKTLVRIQSQIHYSVFNITKAGTVVIGKKGFLFDHSYIKGYTGGDFVGKEKIRIQLQKAKLINAELKKKNVTLFFVFAPGKGSYYAEFIPEQYTETCNSDSTNYACYIQECKNVNFPFIDLRAYFLSMKDHLKHPVFSQVGVHWNDYGAFLAIDTISKYISKQKNMPMNFASIVAFEERDSIKRQDKDVLTLMNVVSDVPFIRQPYLKFNVEKITPAQKPKLLVVADSYFSTIVATGLVDSLYSEWNYWLYNNRMGSDKKLPFSFKNEVESKDVVFMLATDATLGSFPYRFIDEAYEVYAPKNKSYCELKNHEFRQFIIEGFKNIEKDKKWKRQLNKSAKEKNISFVDESINNLIWLYEQQELKSKKFVAIKK